MLPIIKREVKKLLDAKISVPLRYSKWIANLVSVRKKNGEIRPCVEFRNLKKLSLKDNYPLPKMDQLLKRVLGSNMISMLDGFSGYNQILVSQEDKEKTTFMNAKIPFGLINVGATFQREMDLAFVGKINKLLSFILMI